MRCEVVDSCMEKIAQYSILIGSADQAADRQPHARGVVTGQDIAKVPGGHAVVHGIAGLEASAVDKLQIGRKVIDHLDQDSPQVD